jgi:biofilm PGA synthesis lipoprotein PgaB
MRSLSLMVFVLVCQMTTAGAIADGRDPTPAALAVAGTFTLLCYHEARDEVRDYPDPFAVDTAALVRQFAWLRGNGYTPVSLDQIVAARQGGKPLPPKAVLLSFDDAYLSFYKRVYPLLREFHFPAVLGVVGKWIDDPRDGPVMYGEKGTGTVIDASFPTWGQLREMADSGLVEMASHTYDLHHGIVANPQMNLQAAATTRTYDPATRNYENDADWRKRVRADLARNSNVIERETGHRPRAIVWPYGAYNDELVNMAGELGMTIGLTLEEGANTPDVPLTALRRILVAHNPALADFIGMVRGPTYPDPVRVVEVKLDDVYSADPMQQERNLSLLLDRIQVLKPTYVFLQATSDTNGDGIADVAYFPNRQLPLRADLFNRVAWQLTSRVDVNVFAVMPVTSFRLSPSGIAELYEDLARYANFAGLVFDDKSPPRGVEDAGMLGVTRQLALRARAFRAPLKIVRTTINEQSLSAFAAEYDYVALTAMPAHQLAPDPIIRRKLVVVLPNNKALAGQLRTLQLHGVLNFGYTTDDFLHDDPPLSQIAPVMSLRDNPLALRNK